MSANVNEYEGKRGDCEWGSVSEVGRGWGRTYSQSRRASARV